MLRIIAIFLVVFFCFGCSKTRLVLKTYGPDQSTVSQREHLKIPLVLTDLPKPQDK